MRVLAVDPGLTRCGVAVVDGGPGRALVMRHCGVLRTDPDLPVAQRLHRLDV
jgi:crossover junction endodeoxyribonuclease RuvC